MTPEPTPASARIFGTDGVRGRAGEGWLSDGAVSALGRAVAAVLASRPGDAPRRALLGHDGRESGPRLERALSRGLAAAGFEALSVGLITTPGLAWLTRDTDCALGAMISASHNPAEDNGIKVFGGEGEKLSDELELAIEAELTVRGDPVTEGPGPRRVEDLEERYVAHLSRDAVPGLRLDGLRVVVDCANGGGSRVAPRVLEGLGAEVRAIAAAPDGHNINHACGSTHPAALQRAVLEHGADVGIALDGDGDRCILVDEGGALVDGDGILTVCGRHAARAGELPGARLVATVMSNCGLARALREVGVEVDTVGVGDRRVVERLREQHLGLGGEQSGHVVFGADNAFIGDGTYTALRVLRVLRETGETLSALTAPFQRMPQVLINVRVASQPSLTDVEGLSHEVRQVEDALGTYGRVLLRYSGTEPLLRVMVEGPDESTIDGFARRLAAHVEARIGA